LGQVKRASARKKKRPSVVRFGKGSGEKDLEGKWFQEVGTGVSKKQAAADDECAHQWKRTRKGLLEGRRKSKGLAV